MQRTTIAPSSNFDERDRAGRRRAAMFVALFVAQAMNAACSATPAQLMLPEWFEPAARWRSTKPPLNTARLDAAIARHAGEYRELYGHGHYREFAVAPPKTLADVVAAIDIALAASARATSKKEIPDVLDDERELRWIARDKRAVVMVYLSRVDPSRSNAPAFVLLFEPR